MTMNNLITNSLSLDINPTQPQLTGTIENLRSTSVLVDLVDTLKHQEQVIGALIAKLKTLVADKNDLPVARSIPANSNINVILEFKDGNVGIPPSEAFCVMSAVNRLLGSLVDTPLTTSSVPVNQVYNDLQDLNELDDEDDYI